MLFSFIEAYHDDRACSMINLMEGIIPEYDRKGKVRLLTYQLSSDPLTTP